MGYAVDRMITKVGYKEMGLLDVDRLACGQRHLAGTVIVEMKLHFCKMRNKIWNSKGEHCFIVFRSYLISQLIKAVFP